MRAQEFMCCPAVMVSPKTSLAEVARLMAEQRIGCVLVVDREQKLRGIVTQTDFGGDQHGAPFSMELLLQMFSRSMATSELEKLRKDVQRRTVDDIMVTEVFTGREDTPAEELARLMLRYDIEHIPILRDGVPVGIVARHDFLRMIAPGHTPN